jgi:hypothetical protein
MTKKAETGKARKLKGAEQKIGRGNPPKHTRFQRAQAATQGRPKGSKNLSTGQNKSTNT